MTGEHERRAVPRTPLPERPAVHVRGLREVRLLDLSLAGAQIEHLDLVRLDAPCDLDLPAPFGRGTVPAQVVWCTVVGRRCTPSGDSHLISWSGLRFTALTIAQHAALLALLHAGHRPAA